MLEDKPQTPPLPPPIYAVWVEGEGWLRGKSDRIFSDFNRQLAETAARMLTPKAARVELFDGSMQDLEPVFLDQERALFQLRQEKEAELMRLQNEYEQEYERLEVEERNKQPLRRFWRWIYGLLRSVNSH